MPDQDAMDVATAPLPDEIALKAKAEFEKSQAEEPGDPPKGEEAEEEPKAGDDEPEEGPEKAADDETGADSEEEPTDDPEPKKRRRRPSRRDRIIREQGEEIRALKERIEQLAKPQPLVEPKVDDFTNYDDFVKAREDYAREQGKREASEEAERKRKEDDERRTAAEMAAKAREFSTDGMAKYDDFFDVALNRENFDPSPQVANIILESEQAVDVAYYLGKNPDVADRLEDMSPTQAAREIGRIEATLSTRKAKPSSAPAPIKPIGPGKDTPTPKPEDIPYSEYVKGRRAGTIK